MGAWLRLACLALLIGGSPTDDSHPVQGPASSPLVLTPARIDFGSQAVGTTSQPLGATLTNRSDHNLRIRDISPSGIDFAATDTCQGALAAGSHCTIDITFTPAITGPRLGTVVITTDLPSSDFLVLMGTGN